MRNKFLILIYIFTLLFSCEIDKDKKFGNKSIFFAEPDLVFNIPFNNNITVNGIFEVGEWNHDKSLYITDTQGDDPSPYAGCDIQTIYLAHNNTYIFIAIQMADNAPSTNWGKISFDAYQLFLQPENYYSEAESSYHLSITYNSPNWIWRSFSGRKLYDVVIGINAKIEIAIPKNRFSYNPFRIYFSVGTGDDNYDFVSSENNILAKY